MAPVASLEALLDRRLASLTKAHPELTQALALQEVLLRTALTSARPPLVEAFPLPRERALAALRSGTPLLHDQPAIVDIHFAADLFSRLVNALQQRDDPELCAKLTAIATAATSGLLDPEQLFGEAFVQHEAHAFQLAVQAAVDPDLLLTLAHRSVAPVLTAYADHLLPLVERYDDGSLDGTAWQCGYCPICGAWPLIGELRGVELAQFLRCSGCGAGWRSQRLSCPYCSNNDYRTLQTLQIEGEQRFRISTCERCHGYLKVGNAFDPLPAPLLPLDDTASVHLDVIAIERGYHRPSGCGFVIELALPEAEWADELA